MGGRKTPRGTAKKKPRRSSTAFVNGRGLSLPTGGSPQLKRADRRLTQLEVTAWKRGETVQFCSPGFFRAGDFLRGLGAGGTAGNSSVSIWLARLARASMQLLRC